MGNQHIKKTCELCDKMIVAAHFSGHMKDVHSFLDSNMNKQFKCDLCTKSFSRKDIFETHVKSHNKPIQEFSCDVCEKVFEQKRYLKAHVKTHDPKEPLNCTQCGNAYESENGLRRHMKSVHPRDNIMKGDSVGFMIFDKDGSQTPTTNTTLENSKPVIKQEKRKLQ